MPADQVPHISENSRRIAKNTLALYCRMLFLLFVGLFTSRIVLNALGETDFGVYTTVGGFVSMFVVISGALSSAVSRYLTFELGREDKSRLPKVFSTAVTILLAITVLIVILAEVSGPWYMDRYMTIPPERMHAAKIVFQFSVLTFAINLVSVPYNASIIAHERMAAFSYIGIFEGAAKLTIAFLIAKAGMDRLVFYALAMCVVAVLVRVVYRIYCRTSFSECRYSFGYDKGLMKEMSGFAGWNFIGTGAAVLRDHGGTLIINMFYPSAVNAARGLAVQLSGAVQLFARNFMTSMNPQITKSYASGEHDYMMSLVFRGSRFSLYLLLFLSIPAILCTESLLGLWLVDVPGHTAQFVRLALVLTMLEAISYPLITLMLATGDIKMYQIVVGGLQLMNLPLAYGSLRLGGAPEMVYAAAILLSVACLAARIMMLKKMAGLPVRSFVKNVILNILAVIAAALPVPFVVSRYLHDGFWSLVIVCLVSVACTGAAVWAIGLRLDERTFFSSRINQFIRRDRAC